VTLGQGARALHHSRLAAELTDGWTVSESATLTSPSGTVVEVSLARADVTDDVSAFADEQVRRLEGVLPRLTVRSAQSTMIGDRPAEQRQITFERNGAASEGRLVYVLADDLVLSAGAIWEAGDTQADRDVDVVLAGLRVVAPTPLLAGSSATADAPGRHGSRPPSESDWAMLRTSWMNPSSTVENLPVARWSTEDLVVAASVVGATWFPTIPPEFSLRLPAVAHTAVFEATVRSMIARRLLHRPGGTLGLAEPLHSWIEVASFPDLGVLMEQVSGGFVDVRWLGIRSDRGVEVRVTDDGSRELREFDPGDLPGRLIGTAGAGGASTSLPAVLSSDELQTAVRASHQYVRVRSSWCEGSVVAGGEMSWVVDPDGGLALVEFESGATGEPRCQITPADGAVAKARLLQVLPAGGDR
jgi:hypothetical protein